ncbi:hypothetical protein RSOLAG1IB_12231 [Rhizoctonia solani AG-1 IB]|uniref:Uncharacterized protein n=1 Tax=Thanatephorus cucumeris (strain AG1-IB / isolate 7/3/14) TaxID=1108050 RepID=A0A0B7FRZ7_THACB|nr:hypothetical protein RSOLAG1IB_12231 [Rhizoctonia solani AG-1 IB]
MLFNLLLALAAYASATPEGTTLNLPASSLTATSTANPSVTPTSAPTPTSDPALPSPIVAYASDDPSDSLLIQYLNGTPGAYTRFNRNKYPRSSEYSTRREIPGFMAPPATGVES